MDKAFLPGVLKAVILSVILTFSLILIHTAPHLNSMINFKWRNINPEGKAISEEYLSDVIDLHEKFPGFARRPLTSFLTQETRRYTGLGIGASFVVVNFQFLFFTAVALYWLSLVWSSTEKEALLSIILFFASFTILFAFFPTVYTYDEPVQYLSLFLSLIFLKKKNVLIFSLFFFIALVARESSVILYPAIVMVLVRVYGGEELKWSGKKVIASLVISFITVVAYMIFIKLYSAFHHIPLSVSEEKFRLSYIEYNFQSLHFAAESVVSCFLAIGWQILLISFYFFHERLSKAERELIFAFYLTVIVNTLVVLFFAKARETRLFALPLILLWPMLGKYAIAFFRILDWRKALKALRKKEYSLQNQIALAFLVLLIFISYLLAYYSYLPTGSPPEWNLFQEYLLTESVLILLLSFWYWLIRKEQASEKELSSWNG